MTYLTHTCLMRESERTVHETATRGNAPERGICGQLVSDPGLYSEWYARHAQRMQRVGRLLRRKSQILDLRRACIEELHRAALVRTLRDFDVSREERDRTLCLFSGVANARKAAVLEHRNYLLAATSQLCTTRLLALAGDTRGLELIGRYERAFAQHFRLFCEQTRRGETGHRRFLDKLRRKVKWVARGLLKRILGGDFEPSAPPLSSRGATPLLRPRAGRATTATRRSAA